jgi:hypothetical protein
MSVRLDPYILSMFTMLNLSLVQLLGTSYIHICTVCISVHSSQALQIYIYIYCPAAVVYNSPHFEECSSGVTVSYEFILVEPNALAQKKYTNNGGLLQRVISLPRTGREIMDCSGDLPLLHPV